MGQIFHRSFNTLSKLSIFGAVFFIAGIAWVFGKAIRSPYTTAVGIARDQPIPFSHEHHVGGLGIDCRYCHTTVEDSSFAGIPPTKTCMNCHQQIWVGSDMLRPVRVSFREDRSIEWIRIHNLADFAYFDHSIHINKGIGCVSCHGRVDRMPLMWQEHALHMEWCLDCHRHPERYVRPRNKVFDLGWEPLNQIAEGKNLIKKYKVQSLTSCSTCHR